MKIRHCLMVLSAAAVYVSLINVFLSPALSKEFHVPLDPEGTYRLYDKSLALLVYVSDYDENVEKKWFDLPSIEADVEALDTFLTGRGFEVERLKNPTGEELQSTVRNFIIGSPKNSRILIYFGGHGHTVSAGVNVGYLVPRDAPDPRYDETGFKLKSISTYALRSWAQELGARHALILADACFSGALFQNIGGFSSNAMVETPSGAKPRRFWEQVEGKGFHFITAGNKDEPTPAESDMVDVLLGLLSEHEGSSEFSFVTADTLALKYRDSIRYQVNTTDQRNPRIGTIPLETNIREGYDPGAFVFLTNSGERKLLNIEETKIYRTTGSSQTNVSSGNLFDLNERPSGWTSSFSQKQLLTQVAFHPHATENSSSHSHRYGWLHDTFLGEYKASEVFEDIMVHYFRKSNDGEAVLDALDQLSVPFVARPAQLSKSLADATNGLACHPDVDIRAVQAIALALIRNGVQIRLIRSYRAPKAKPTGRVEVLSFAGGGFETARPISPDQIKSMKSCPDWYQN